MVLRITGHTSSVENNIQRASGEAASSLERLSSGVRFTRSEPLPAERAISDSLGRKLQNLQTYKRNASEGLSLVDTADSALGEATNITIRLGELATQSTNPGLSDLERRFLFVEYHGLFKELERIAKTTEYNGQPLLYGLGGSNGVQTIEFLVGDPNTALQANGTTLNRISLKDVSGIDATPQGLGLVDASELLRDAEDGVTIEAVEDLFDLSGSGGTDSFRMALDRIGEYRAQFGAVGSRLHYALDVMAVQSENLQAAQSAVRDVDYATEISNLTRANILVQAGSSLLSQANLPARSILTLIRDSDR